MALFRDEDRFRPGTELRVVGKGLSCRGHGEELLTANSAKESREAREGKQIQLWLSASEAGRSAVVVEVLRRGR